MGAGGYFVAVGTWAVQVVRLGPGELEGMLSWWTLEAPRLFAFSAGGRGGRAAALDGLKEAEGGSLE